MTKLEVTIRKLTEADAGIYQDLRLESLLQEPEAFGASYDECKRMSQQEIERRINPGDGSFILGAFTNNQLCGTSGFFRQKNSKTMHKGVVWGVYVSPDLRGKGISRSLLVETIQKARLLSEIEELLLTVVTTNKTANKLYETLGFNEYGVEENALKIGDKYFSERLMRLVLKSGQNPI